MKMYSKNIVRCISMLEDIYVIVIAVISLMGTVDRVSTTVTYLLLLSDIFVMKKLLEYIHTLSVKEGSDLKRWQLIFCE